MARVALTAVLILAGFVATVGLPNVLDAQAPSPTPSPASGVASAASQSEAYLRQLEIENKGRELMNMRIAMVAVCTFALISWLFLFVKMQPGFGPMNLRAFGIVLVTTFATFLALLNSSALTAAIGLLGAVAGYLFGTREGKGDADDGRKG